MKPAPDFTADVLVPLRKAQAVKAEQDRIDQLAREAAEVEARAAARRAMVIQPVPAARSYSAALFGSLMGSIGYAFAGGNCVNQIAPGNRPDGNPITWAVTTQTPYIGAAGLFPYNHVVRVTGLWSNGDVEVANENWNGVPVTRFPRSAFRGFR